jgi:NADH dehydrogenase
MKVVIVGGGFAGVKAALELSKDSRIKVTLISDRDHFLFYPTLYSTATGRSRLQSILPLDQLFSRTRVKVVKDTVVSIDAIRRIIVTKDQQLHYDKVVFALGVVTSYFGIAGLDRYSYSIKSAHEIERFKKHLHDELTDEKHFDKNYIVVGAGPTGVELSAALAHYLRSIAKCHKIRQKKVHISLVEAAPRVLPRLSEQASELVARRLKKLGIKVDINKKVEAEDDDSIQINGKDIPSKTVVWTSGVANHPFFAEHADLFMLAKNGRVEVDEHLKVDDSIYVIGDNANTPYTGLAQTAIYDGIYVAKAIRAELHHTHPPTYKPKRKAVVIPVGANWALLEYGPFRLTGFLASVIRRFADLIGFTDFFSFPTAFRLWLMEEQRDEDCTVCRQSL